MTLLVACLLIYVGELHWGWYVLASYVWMMKQFIKGWGALFDASSDPS